MTSSDLQISQNFVTSGKKFRRKLKMAVILKMSKY